jgi:hypothetical protein
MTKTEIEYFIRQRLPEVGKIEIIEQWQDPGVIFINIHVRMFDRITPNELDYLQDELYENLPAGIRHILLINGKSPAGISRVLPDQISTNKVKLERNEAPYKDIK